MAVHRIGPAEEQEQHTVSLGKVLVTTTDLEALTEILRTRIYSADALANKPKRHRIEFDGGYFDEVSDLPTLSDGEARSLRLQGKGVQIVLSPERAVAIGDRKEAEDIYKMWARSRQTTESPASRKFSDRPVVYGLILSAVITVLLLVSAAPQVGNRPLWLHIAVGVVIFIPISVFVGLIILGFNNLHRILPPRFLPKNYPSYAVVHPYSLDEYRRNRSANRFPRIQTIVAIVSLIVAAVAVYTSWGKVVSRLHTYGGIRL